MIAGLLVQVGVNNNLLLHLCFRVVKDMDGVKAQLIGPEEEGSICLVTLLITGRATPYLHNGVVYVGDEDHYVGLSFDCLFSKYFLLFKCTLKSK